MRPGPCKIKRRGVIPVFLTLAIVLMGDFLDPKDRGGPSAGATPGIA